MIPSGTYTLKQWRGKVGRVSKDTKQKALNLACNFLEFGDTASRFYDTTFGDRPIVHSLFSSS
jgi:hypothetical protein